MALERREADLHGLRLAYAESPGSGIPVVLIHGVGSSIDSWGDVGDSLAAAGRHVIAVDLIGHGASNSGNGDFSLGANASAIRDLLDALEIDRVHLIGHSYGGGVSLQFTYQFPERVASLVLMSSGGLGSDVHFGLRAASLPGSEMVLRAAVSPRVVNTLHRTRSALSRIGLRHRGVSERTLAKLQRLQDESRLTGFVSTVRGVIGPEGQRVQAVDRLAGLSPEHVLIIWGDADAMLPVEHGRRAHAILHGSHFVEIADAGHHPQDDAPDRVFLEILGHLARVETATTADDLPAMPSQVS
jgi:pimeloyl-ACP methyl ester carboxylesterase